MSMTLKNNEQTTVFFDGSCPLCTREISFYRKRRGGEGLQWIDVSTMPEGDVAPGLSKRHALARFHARTADGRLISGGKAFAHLWSALPAFRLLGLVFRTWPLSWVIDRAYDLFLRFRPQLRTALCKL